MEYNVITFEDKCSIGHIGIQGIGWAHGSFCSVQLFGDWTDQIQWCAAGILQPVPLETVLWQSPIGSCHDLATWHRSWRICGLARHCLVC